ncbi:MAG: hypothetical protein ACYC0V_05250 [Armatimonadota bacterium]
MVDRTARDKMIAATRSFMDSEIGSFRFDEILYEIKLSTKDETVKDVADLLWDHYDDLKDHEIVVSKKEWDLFNRLLLLLESDATLKFAESSSPLCWRNFVAGASLACFLALACHSGFGTHLFAKAIAFGLISMLLSFLGSRAEASDPIATKVNVVPFASIGNLLTIRRMVPEFSRHRYPHGLKTRRLRSPIAGFMMYIPAAVLWLIFSPIVLFLQTSPEKVVTASVELPGQCAH